LSLSREGHVDVGLALGGHVVDDEAAHHVRGDLGLDRSLQRRDLGADGGVGFDGRPEGGEELVDVRLEVAVDGELRLVQVGDRGEEAVELGVARDTDVTLSYDAARAARRFARLFDFFAAG
jgi:hypothetical protein